MRLSYKILNSMDCVRVCQKIAGGRGYLTPDAHCIRGTSEQHCKHFKRKYVYINLYFVKKEQQNDLPEPGISVAAK